MAGGRTEHVERVRPVIGCLAARFTRMGESGAGQVTKLCNQVIVGSLLPVLAEAVRLAEAAGVDATRLPEALKGGFADSLPLQIFGARMAAREFEPRLAAAELIGCSRRAAGPKAIRRCSSICSAASSSDSPGPGRAAARRA